MGIALQTTKHINQPARNGKYDKYIHQTTTFLSGLYT